MRVLHLTTEFPPVVYGGLGTAVGGWVHASAQAGMTMGVLLVEGPLVAEGSAALYGAPARYRPLVEEAVEGGEQAVIDSRGIRFFRRSWQESVEAGVRVATQWHPDVVHLHTAMVWPVAEAIQRRVGVPLVYHVHSVDRAEYEIGAEPQPWLVQSPQEAAISAADRVIALCRDERDLLERYYPAARERVRVVGNGIEESEAAAAAAVRPRDPASPMVLYSGRLVERKGIRELVAAIPRVLEASPNARFVFAGGPPPLPGEAVAAQWMTPELERWQANVRFTGWLGSAELSAWYREADVLVVPSRYEPFGMVILEGMLHGLPIVASDVGGPAEILEHGRTALLFPPRDTDALATALNRLVTDAELRRAIGTAGAREVRRRWMWPERVRSMRSVYGELIAA